MNALVVTDRAGVLTLADGDALSALGIGGDAVGKPIRAAPAVLAAFAKARAGESHTTSIEAGGARFDLRCHPLLGDGREVTGALVLALEAGGVRDRLASSEARLADAQRLAHVGSWDWDVARNLVTWSDEMHRIYGLEPGQFDGTYEAFLARVHPDDRQHTENVVLDAYRTGKPFVYDHRILRPDGEARMLHTRGDVTPDAQGKPMRLGGSCWDVTDTWKAEQQLERSLSLLRASLESTADGLMVVDGDGKVAAYNQRLLELWGLTRSVVEGATFDSLMALVHDQLENSAACLRRVLELRAQPGAESFDTLLFRDGRVFERYSRPQRIGDEIVGRVWSYRDVTDREGLLRRAVFLSDASRLLTSLDVEAGLEGVARLSLPVVADACAVDLFAEAGGPRRLLSIALDQAKPMSSELPREVFAGQSLLWTEAAASFVVVPITARDSVLGAITFSVGGERRYGEADLDLFRELAGRAGLAVENARLYRRASEALAARDEFLSIAAHEIRGPVTALHLAAQGLQDTASTSEARLKLLQIIEREDRRLARFVEELLDVGRIRSGGLHLELAKVDLAEVVREVVARLAPEVTRSRSALAVSVDGAVLGMWDRVRLDDVVSNVLMNAIKFGLGKPITVTLSAERGLARLIVRDHGIGIAADRHERIFEPFERAVSARHYGGLGLGLYIVRRIVESLGGTVTVRSKPDEGTAFIVELPQGSAS